MSAPEPPLRLGDCRPLAQAVERIAGGAPACCAECHGGILPVSRAPNDDGPWVALCCAWAAPQEIPERAWALREWFARRDETRPRPRRHLRVVPREPSDGATGGDAPERE